MSKFFRRRSALGALFAACALAYSALGADTLFNDPIIVKAKSFQLRESDLQEAYASQKAAAAALGRPSPGALENTMKKQLLDKMIATRLLVSRATPQDRDDAKKIAAKIKEESLQVAGSEAAYRRRLLALGSSPEKYEEEILEQAVVQAVIDRELKRRQPVPKEEVKKFYDEHPEIYAEPEKARVAQILFATRKIPTGEPLPLEQRMAKKTAADKAAARARTGEDFTKLVQELSDDVSTKSKNGEITFSRDAGTVPPQFEAAAFSLQIGQISDPVLSVFGYHIIKLLERTPPSKTPFDKVHDRIVEHLQRKAVQDKVPDYLERLKKEANVQVLLQ